MHHSARNLGLALRSLQQSPHVLARLIVISLLALIGIGTLAALGAYRLSMTAPGWWRTVDAADTATITLAEDTEQAVTTTLYAKHELGSPWTVAVSAAQANAWVNVMLPRWLENQDIDTPEWVSQIQFHFDPEWIGCGVMVPDEQGRQRYVTLRARALVDDSGALWLRPVGASIGRVGMPLRWTFEEMARRAEGPAEREVVDAIRGLVPVSDEIAVELGDGRVVRMLAARPDKGRLLVTCVTER